MIIDISKYQSHINWPALKANAQGVTGVMIKATQGHNYTDEQFTAHVNGAISCGIDFGFYHFASLNNIDIVKDATQEANDFYIRTKGYKVTLPYALDLEVNELKLSKDDVLKYVETFVSVLHGLGITDIILYSYTPFLNSNLPATHTLAHQLPLWIAAYAPVFLLPNGWDKAFLWQFTQKGIVDGVVGAVDMSKYV